MQYVCCIVADKWAFVVPHKFRNEMKKWKEIFMVQHIFFFSSFLLSSIPFRGSGENAFRNLNF